MNFDRRRVNGPEESFSPVYSSDEEDAQTVKPSQPSRKGRQPSEIRPICTACSIALLAMLLILSVVLKTGLISQANGSSYIETERTKIACSVWVALSTHFPKNILTDMHPRYGPRQSKATTYAEKGRLNVEVKFAPFSCKKRRAPMRVS